LIQGAPHRDAPLRFVPSNFLKMHTIPAAINKAYRKGILKAD
jgi:hypothetical protein